MTTLGMLIALALLVVVVLTISVARVSAASERRREAATFDEVLETYVRYREAEADAIHPLGAEAERARAEAERQRLAG